MSQSLPLSPVASFAAIIELVCKAVACCGGARPIGISGLPVKSLPGPLLTLIWNRLHRIIARFTRAATTPPAPPRSRAKRPARPHQPDPLPRHYAWLRTLVQETGGGASQLEFFLNQPDITALIAADPRLGRILRPLCHMLGIRRDQVPSLYPPIPPKQALPPPLPPPDAQPASPSAATPPPAVQAAFPPITSPPGPTPPDIPLPADLRD